MGIVFETPILSCLFKYKAAQRHLLQESTFRREVEREAARVHLANEAIYGERMPLCQSCRAQRQGMGDKGRGEISCRSFRLRLSEL